MMTTDSTHLPHSHAGASTPGRALHVVQIGFDESVFHRNAPSDTLHRQLEYGRELDRQRPGSRLSFVIVTQDPTADEFHQENVTFIPLSGSRWQRLLRLYKQLNVLHGQHVIDVITTQTIHWEAWVALLFGKRYHVPIVGQIHYDLFSPHASRQMMGSGIYQWLYSGLSRGALRRMAAVRVVGQRIRDRLVASGLNRNVHALPVPVTMTMTMTLPTRDADPGSEVDQVLFVGRLAPEKNMDAWLQVARQVVDRKPDTVFAIVGDGPLREALEAQVIQLGLQDHICFSGNVAYNELSALYRASKLFLLTSRYEGFGRVLVEAYFNGIPAVAPRITGVEDIIVDGETGFLQSPADIAGFASSVLCLLEDARLRREMAAKGRDRVLHLFDAARLTHEWIHLLISVTSKDRL
jgi:glycosyltransferase involved in cell wall biosynthesis